jgi:hypothetical protein
MEIRSARDVIARYCYLLLLFQDIIIYYCLKSFMDPKGMDMHCLGRLAAKFFFLFSSYLLFLINIDDWCDMPA